MSMETPGNNAGNQSAGASIYCNACGAENPAGRGACILCYAYLREDGHGLPCPSCGHDNDKSSNFCQNCGNPFAPGAQRIPTLVESAIAVLHGGTEAMTSDHDQGVYQEEEEEGGFLGGQPSEAEEEAPQPAPQAAAATPAPTPPAPAAPAPPSYSEDELGMPPSALDLEEPVAPPPPPPAPAAAEEKFDEDFAPPPPPPDLADEQQELAPPPPPPAVAQETVAPAPAPAPTPAPAAPPAPPATEPAPAAPGLVDPLAQASAESEDEDFGDWSLEMNDKEDKDQQS